MVKNVRETLDTILECFASGKIPDAIAYSMFPAADLPSSKWSFINRINMLLSGTRDARGYSQWKSAERYVKKGAKAIYILVPRMIKRKIENEQGDEQEEEILMGFMAKPVFRVEDTDGKPLSYENIKLPDLPLMYKAREWGISVKTIPGNYRCYGYFSQSQKEITLATKDEAVFFHELSHVAHQRLVVGFQEIATWKKEVVAELAAVALCKIVGKTSKHLGNSYQYIKHYASKTGLSPVKASLEVLNEVKEVLDLILQNGKVEITS